MCQKHPNQVTAEKIIADSHACNERIRLATEERNKHVAALYQICPHENVVQFFQVNPKSELENPSAFVVRACTTCGMHEDHTVACSAQPAAEEFTTCSAFKTLSTPKEIRHVQNYREINQVKLYPGAP